MGNGMNKVLPGLYVGNYRDSKDAQQLDRFNITHIIAIHDSPRRLMPDKHYLCVMAQDTPDQNVSQYFSVCNDFIHAARLRDGNVLIHCLAGMSRSVTVAVAYIMSVTTLSWKEALKVVRAGRSVANPNLGFQTQLQDFEMYKLTEERKRLKERYPSNLLAINDREQCSVALNCYAELLLNRDICEGRCPKGDNCPTGLSIINLTKLNPSNTEPATAIASTSHSKSASNSTLGKTELHDKSLCYSDANKAGGIFRRKHSSSSLHRSRLSVSGRSSTNPSSGLSPHAASRSGSSNSLSKSCPTSPRYGQKYDRKMSAGIATSIDEASTEVTNLEPTNNDDRTTNFILKNKENASLHRSASTVSNNRPRSGPAGLYSYTGSAPPSVHGSRVDLSSANNPGTSQNPGGTNSGGSAIYLGCQPPSRAGSSWSISSRVSIGGGSGQSTPINTPPASPKHAVRRTNKK